jgi:hypothetical protein
MTNPIVNNILRRAHELQTGKYKDLDIFPENNISDKTKHTEYTDELLTFMIAQFEEHGNISSYDFYNMCDDNMHRVIYDGVYLGTITIDLVINEEAPVKIQHRDFNIVVHNINFTQELWDKFTKMLKCIIIPDYVEVGLIMALCQSSPTFKILNVPKYISHVSFEEDIVKDSNTKYTIENFKDWGYVEVKGEENTLYNKFDKIFFNEKLQAHNPHKLPIYIYVDQIEIKRGYFFVDNCVIALKLHKASACKEYIRPNVETIGDWQINITDESHSILK